MVDIEKILQQDELPLGMDIVALFQQGIEHLKEYSGEFWDDFELHDPGITILEQICYSLTDLFYRSSLDVEKILQSNGREINLPRPHEVFSSNPLTTNDLRKQILNDVSELNNVWVLPVSEKKSSFNGIFDLWLDVDVEYHSEKRQKTIIEKVRKTFCKYRNLCEDIYDIKILEPLNLFINARIETDESKLPEDIYAEVLYKISTFFRPTVQFYSLEEMQKEYPIEQIYEGPLLTNGFVKNDDLKPKAKRILISDLIKLLLEIEGIISVKKLTLEHNEKIYDSYLTIEDTHLPYLANIDTITEQHQRIELTAGNFTFQGISPDSIKRKLNVLRAGAKHIVRFNDPNQNEDTVFWEIGTYKTIQYDMPQIYGVGEMGLGNFDPPERKAAAKQLKAYLLLFDQIMANYLSQLSNLNLLYTISADSTPSYYTQSLEKFKGITELIVKQNGQAKKIETPFFRPYNIPQDYEKGTMQILKQFDNFIERQNRFMDFLLAINGQTFPENALIQVNSYFTNEEYQVKILDYKKRLFFHLNHLNQKQAKAFNYMANGAGNVSGLQNKAALMLGLEAHLQKNMQDGFKEPFISESFSNYGFELSNTNIENDIDDKFQKEIQEKINKQEFDFIDDDEFDIKTFTEEEIFDTLEKTSLFKTKKIFNEFFNEGIKLINYQVGKTSKGYTLIYQKFGTQEWTYLGDFKTEVNAGKTALVIIDFFKKTGINAEGMYLIEHTLLRPRLTQKQFGFYLHDANLEPFLYSTKLYTFKERLEILSRVKKYIYQRENYSVIQNKNGDFEIRFTVEGEQDIELISTVQFESVQKTYALLEEAFDFLSDKYEIVDYPLKYSFFVKFPKPEDRIPEDFFSYRASVVFPNWTNRFIKNEFRVTAQKILRQIAPAYISLDFFWLSPKDMKRFEGSYFMWKDNFLTIEKSEDNELNKKMIRNLFEYKKGKPKKTKKTKNK